ncbi:MAG TPA: L,D-transpeptidase family protein [Pyrinomonadaceae bacterium]|jgi:peptidoglycan hydrolase-like protein with peptidoglycan-binding domain
MKVLVTICLLLISTPVVASAQTRNRLTKGAPQRIQPGETPAVPVLTRAQIKEAERRLSDIGYWTGAVDGVLDGATRAAVIAFQKYEGRPITGRLTIDELDAIRNSAGPKARESGYAHVEVDLDRQVLLIVGERSDQSANPDSSGAHSKETTVRVLPVSTGNDQTFTTGGQESIAYTPRGRFVVYDKSFGWENGQLGSVYYANYITGGVAIHGYLSVPNEPASHGCIRIPMFAAREVSKLLRLGTIVLVYDRVSFVSAKEWADNPRLKEAAMLNAAATDYVDHTTTRSRKGRTKVIRT